MDCEINFKDMVDDINDLVQSVTSDGSFLYTNRAWRETLGYSEKEIKLLKLSDIVHPDSFKHYLNNFQKVMRGEKSTGIETVFLTKSGEKIIVAGSSNCAFKDGQPFATRSIFSNITSRKKSEQDLRDTEELFQAFMDNTPLATFMKDEEGRYVYTNKQHEKMFQIKFDALEGQTDFVWLPTEIAETVRKNDRRILESWENSELLETVPTPDGSSKHWLVMKFPFKQFDGRKFVGGVAIDITKLKETEAKLRQSEQEIRSLVGNSPDAIARFGVDLRYLFVNPAIERVIGIGQDKFIGKRMAEVGLPDEVCAVFEEKLMSAISTGKEQFLELQNPMPDVIRYYQCRFTPEFDEHGEAKSILTISRDMTAQKEIEEDLRRKEEHFRHLIEDSHGLICTHDLDGTILSVNPATLLLLGYKSSEIIGRNLREFFIPAGREKFDDYLKRIRQNSVDSGLMIVTAKDGTQRTWKYHNVKLSETVEEPFILGHAQDVTEMHETQKHLENLSLTDDLTGLYNRRGFLMLAERQLKIVWSRPKNREVYLIFADIDGLKQINDNFGHNKGSMAIVKIGEILASNFRASDIVARLGGDEFVMFVTDNNNADKAVILNRLQTKIDNYNKQKNHPFDLSLSVGITSVDLNEKITIEELLVRADMAMYEQKRKKKSQGK